MAWSGKRWLISCGLGCGGMIVLAIGLIVAFNIWLSRPGKLLEPQQLVGNDTTGYVEWTLSLDDPETEGFVLALIAAIQEMPTGAEEFPPWMADWMRNRQRREAEKDILKLLPLVLAWTVRPAADADEDLHLLTLSIEPLGNRLVFGDWILGLILRRIEGAEVHMHGREKIYQLPLVDDERLTFFLRGAHAFVTSDLDTARLAVDRLSAHTATGDPANQLRQLFDAAEARALRGALTNSRGELTRLWRQLPQEPGEGSLSPDLLGRAESLTVTGGLEADGSLAGTLWFRGPDAQWAAGHAAELERALRERTRWIELDFELVTAVAGDHVRIDFRLPDLVGAIRHALLQGVEIDEGEGRVRIDL